MSEKYCTIDFRKFVSVMRHVSGDSSKCNLQGVYVERGAKKGLNVVATNNVTIAFNNDPNAEVTDSFPGRGLIITPKAAWFNVKDTGKIVVHDDEISFEMDSKKIQAVQSKEHLVTDVQSVVSYDMVMDINPDSYSRGLNTCVSPEALRCFMPNNAKAFNKGAWDVKMHPPLQFWTKDMGDDKVVIVTSLDPAFVGGIMPIEQEKQLPSLKMVNMLYRLNRTPAPPEVEDIDDTV